MSNNETGDRRSELCELTHNQVAMWNDFRTFIARGNVIDLAIAVIIGAAFGKIVTTLVDAVLMPPLGLVIRGIDFASLFVVLDSSKGVPASLAEAKERGIPVIAYGQLLNDVIGFLVIAFVVFFLVRQVNRLKRESPPPSPTARDCPFCTLSISLKATRCPHCTSPVQVQGT
jgi:large conductance mechanosensitive channel